MAYSITYANGKKGTGYTARKSNCCLGCGKTILQDEIYTRHYHYGKRRVGAFCKECWPYTDDRKRVC